MSPRTRIVASDADCSLAVRARLMITVWRTDVTAARIASLDRVISELVPTCKGRGYAAITVVEPTISMRMPEDARDASTALQRRWESEMKCSAYLVDGTSFLQSVVRTMTAGMALVTRSRCPVKVFSDAPSCSGWVAPFAGLDRPEVERAIEEARGAR